MPVYLHLANLVFDKKAITQKYTGGCNQFRIDHSIGSNKYNQEDDELFSLSAMNLNDFSIDTLIEEGLTFDQEFSHSNDFVAVTRYGGAECQANWFNHNGTFAWHVNCDKKQEGRAKTYIAKTD